MRVALIGASGVLGRALVPRLVAAGAAVRSLARSPERVPNAGSVDHEIERFDLLSADAGLRLNTLLEGCDAVVHAATAIPADPRVLGAWDANTRLRQEGTRTLLGIALAAGVGQYVQQSIAMAYADGGEQWLDEEAPLDNSSARAAICAPVRTMEAMVRAIPPTRLRWSILRAGSFVGPGTAQDRVVAGLRAGSEKTMSGGAHYLPLVHVEDVASAFVLAIQSGIAGVVLNVNDEPIRQRDYLERLATQLGAASPSDVAGAAPVSIRSSAALVARTLRWRPITGIWPTTYLSGPAPPP